MLGAEASFSTGGMPLLSHNQQCQTIEGLKILAWNWTHEWHCAITTTSLTSLNSNSTARWPVWNMINDWSLHFAVIDTWVCSIILLYFFHIFFIAFPFGALMLYVGKRIWIRSREHTKECRLCSCSLFSWRYCRVLALTSSLFSLTSSQLLMLSDM